MFFRSINPEYWLSLKKMDGADKWRTTYDFVQSSTFIFSTTLFYKYLVQSSYLNSSALLGIILISVHQENRFSGSTIIVFKFEEICKF